jgi:Asp-tRNA(Asn)/Glu-tRNA(Gln) amidotransferase A subunit family amidase
MRAVRWAALTLTMCLTADATADSTQGRTLDLLTATVADLQSAVESGSLTYERLIQQYLARIAAYDKAGPQLNAVIAINPRALDRARALDDERRTAGRRSPLHGIPIAVKDNIDTDELPTTGGNVLFAGSVPPRDARVVERLRQAGAIVFIKTNLDEFAMSSAGLSSLGGQTLNPFNLAHSPGGSSGGTAVAVSAAFATVGLATETGLSIRGPASNTGIVGIAPTQGLVSRAGVIPVSFTQDRVGVHAKSVADAAVVLSIIRGFDPEDLSTADSLGRIEAKTYSTNWNEGLAGMRVGVLRDLFRKEPQAAAGNALVESQLKIIAARGATIVDGQTTGLDLIDRMPSLRVNSYEVRTAFDAYLRRRGPTSPIKTLLELVATGKYLRGGNMETRLQETMKVDVLDFDVEYRRRLDGRGSIRKALVDLMDRERLDALVYPVKPVGAPPIGTADASVWDNPISAVSGLPAIVVPVGLHPNDGLPLAIEMLGRPFSEPSLIRLAAAYEHARGPRILPKTTPALAP